MVNNKVSKGAKIRNRYNQIRYQWESNKLTVRHHKREPRGQPFPNHKAHINRRVQRHSKHKTEKNTYKIHKTSTTLERSVKYYTGGLKPF